MTKAGLVRKGDGKDVDHKNRNTADNRRKNLRVVSKSKNRSFSRKKKKWARSQRSHIRMCWLTSITDSL
jgi:hypothetical protein